MVSRPARGRGLVSIVPLLVCGAMTVTGSTAPRALLNLPGGVKLIVPDSLDSITSYVLREQGDWFEDELRFVRKVVGRGESAIDVGANYGVYALSLCAAVGEQGAVCAFEPASATASFLRQSIEENGFRCIVVEVAALSDRAGTGWLTARSHAEQNRLVATGEEVGTEPVPVKTLDQCMAEYGWTDVALLKVDAEGEEARIVRGGARFFAQLSPLVLFERVHGRSTNAEAIGEFTALGYETYRLVPGMDVLVPFDAATGGSDAPLNLLCCKPDRAARLAARGFLVTAASLAEIGTPVPAGDWREYLERMPYAARLADSWRFNAEEPLPGHEANALGIGLYVASRDPRSDPALRFAALAEAYLQLGEACSRAAAASRLSTLARIAGELGQRAACREALRRIVAGGFAGGTGELTEPFLVASPRFEPLEPTRLDAWFLAAAIEQFERVRHYSSIYTGDSALALIDRLVELGYGSAEMATRRSLVAARAAARARFEKQRERPSRGLSRAPDYRRRPPGAAG
jgi:FkbM family methyltransferase